MNGRDLYEAWRRNMLAQGRERPEWSALTEETRNVWRCTAADARRMCG